MAKAGKKYQDAVKLIEEGKVYAPSEAMELVKKTGTAKFDETVELHVRLGVDPKYADQQVRSFCLTEPVRRSECWSLPKAIRSLRQNRRALILLVRTSW